MVRFNNNTGFEDEHIMSEVRYFSQLVKRDQVESIEINDKTINFHGHDDNFLGEFSLDNNQQVSGTVIWFNEYSGEGQVRLESGADILFYACNVVGADSPYPQLCTNVQYKDGDKVKAEFPADHYTGKHLGLINVEGV